MSKLTPPQLLQHMEVPSRPGVFILGSLERRVTLYSQQVRALNLIHALLATERLKEGQRVAVLGGGAAGLTAAAGAALRGCSVTLLEQMHTLLPIFQRSRKRLLHPHLYDWPEEGWRDEHAGLPVLDWKAGVASEVASQLLRGWAELCQSHRIDLHLEAKDITLHPSSDSSHPLSWYAQQLHDDRFQVVILAVGFGLERRMQGVPPLSYWDDDNLDQPQRDPAHPLQRVLVSGTGDGGLVDLLRIRLEGFEHETLVRDFLSSASLKPTCEELLDIERRVRNGALSGTELSARYKQLPVPQALAESLHKRLRKDTAAVLNGMEPFPLSAKASMLNRFLVSHLLWRSKDGARFVSGPIQAQPEGNGYSVTFASGKREHFDRLIVRHGAQPALSAENGFGWLSQEDLHQLRARNELDQTRTPLWDDQTFALKRARAVMGPTTPREPPQRKKDRMVGRKRELGLLVDELLSSSPSPVVVLGPLGTGKSAIARAALKDPEVKKRYKHRYFVCLDGTDTVEAIPARIAQEMHVSGVSELKAQVLSTLGEAPTLLILDNADTPWQRDRAGMEDLLQELVDLPELALVTTIRGLQQPDFEETSLPVVVNPLTYEDSHKLFCSIAYHIDPNHPELPALLREMGGVALAVKLLAKQAEGAALEVTLDRWRRQGTKMLRSASAPDSSLAARLEFFLESPRLTQQALGLLSVLALLPRGMADKHCSDLLPENPEAIALLQQEALVESEGRRSRLPPVIREHVRANRPPPEDLERKTLNFYFALARRLGAQVGKDTGREAYNQLFEEIDNIEALLLVALEKGEGVEEAIDAALAVSDFVRFSGRGSLQPLLTAANVAKSQGNKAKYARCLLALSRLHLLRRPRYDQARKLLEEALQLFQDVEDLKGEAECYRELGHTAANEYEVDAVEGQLEQAATYFQRALSLQVRFKDPIGEAYCIHGLARVARLQSRNEDARRLFRQTLEMFREQKDQLGRAYSLRHLGELEDDDRLLREACDLFQKAGELRNLAHALRSRSELFRKRGDLDKAEQLREQASRLDLKLQTDREAVASRINSAQVAAAPSKPQEARPVAAHLAPTTRLPQPRELFGRQALKERLVECLLAEKPLPTTVLGPPGVGKSTLTIAALHSQEVEQRYGPHRYFLRLDGVSTADRLNTEIAQELGLPPGQDLPARMATLFGDRPALLVLDNAETPWMQDRQATEDLLTKLASIPRLALLLSVRGRVKPSLPRMGPALEVPLLEPDAARALFQDIAGDIDLNDSQLAQLLEQQQGLALAITLLARAAEGVNPQRTYQRWQQIRGKLLEQPETQNRYGSLAVSFELSLQSSAVSPTARRLLSVLSKLPAGVADEDLESLFPEDLDAPRVLEKAGLAFSENRRLRVLAPLREYLEREHPPTEDDWLRAVDHYTMLAWHQGAQVGYAQGAAALARLGHEVPNLDVVILEGLQSDDPRTAIFTVLKLSNFMRFSGYGAIETVEQALEKAQSLGDVSRVAQCLYTAGQLRLRRSEHERARELSKQALPLFEQLADPLGQARCLQTLGSISLDDQELEKAQVYFERAMPLRQQLGERQGFGNCLHGLGKVALARKQLGEARGHFNEALRLFEEIDNDLGRAHCLRSLGELDADVRQLEEAQGLFEKVGYPRGMGHCLRGRADIAFQNGQLKEADALYQQALQLLQQVGSVRGVANCLLGIGYLERQRGNNDAARKAFEQALKKYQHVQDKAHEDECRRQLSGQSPPSAGG